MYDYCTSEMFDKVFIRGSFERIATFHLQNQHLNIRSDPTGLRGLDRAAMTLSTVVIGVILRNPVSNMHISHARLFELEFDNFRWSLGVDIFSSELAVPPVFKLHRDSYPSVSWWYTVSRKILLSGGSIFFGYYLWIYTSYIQQSIKITIAHRLGFLLTLKLALIWSYATTAALVEF